MTYSRVYENPRLANERIWGEPPWSIDNMFAYASMKMHSQTFAGTAWPTANLIIYYPLLIRNHIVAKRLWWTNSGTAVGTNEVGIYNRKGQRLLTSGSFAKTTTNWQTFDIPDTPLAPDLYYLAIQHSENTATFTVSAPAVGVAAALGVRTETPGGMGLPANATWIVPHALTYLQVVGILTDVTY